MTTFYVKLNIFDAAFISSILYDMDLSLEEIELCN